MVDEQNVNTETLVKAFLNQDYSHLESLRKRNASKEDFDSAVSSTNTLRKKLLDGMIDLRFKLIKMTDEKGWKRLGKDFGKFFKGDKAAL